MEGLQLFSQLFSGGRWRPRRLHTVEEQELGFQEIPLLQCGAATGAGGQRGLGSGSMAPSPHPWDCDHGRLGSHMHS